MQPEGVNPPPAPKKPYNKTNKKQKNKEGRKQHHHISLFMERERPLQTS